jgi:nucleotide-binding universal stress UspA family protein
MEPTLTYSIVCAVDASEYASAVLTHLFDTAARHGLADCHVVTVIPDRSGVFRTARAPDALEHDRVEARAGMVKQLAQVFEDLDVRRAQRDRTWIHVRCGDAPEQIVELAAEAGADLILVGRFGASDDRKSVADRVLARAECPVLVVQGGTYAEGGRPEQCEDCVAVRRGTHGEQWFCQRHHGEAPVLATTFVVGTSMGGTATGGIL